MHFHIECGSSGTWREVALRKMTPTTPPLLSPIATDLLILNISLTCYEESMTTHTSNTWPSIHFSLDDSVDYC